MNDIEQETFDKAIQSLRDANAQLLATKQEFGDFRQEVSNIAAAHIKHAFTVQEKHPSGYKVTIGFEKQADATAWFDQLLSLPDFIIPKPKPDPLVEAMNEALGRSQDYEDHDADALRAALDAAGFEIREKNDD